MAWKRSRVRIPSGPPSPSFSSPLPDQFHQAVCPVPIHREIPWGSVPPDDCSEFSAALRDPRFWTTSVFGPLSFRRYLRDQGLPHRGRTAESISVDYFERLPADLRQNDTMVLRLGRSPEDPTETGFALIRIPGAMRKAFFLFDEEVFVASEPVRFLPGISTKRLLPFTLLGTLTEDSATLLAFASGLLTHALELDEDASHILPARGNSAYSFKFRAHPSVELEMAHDRGQVEIDQIFVAKRKGVETVFIIESKFGARTRSLAKHKLVYPVLAIRRQAIGLPTVPVYIRIERIPEGLLYKIAVCDFDTSCEPPCLSDLRVSSSATYCLALPALGGKQNS